MIEMKLLIWYHCIFSDRFGKGRIYKCSECVGMMNLFLKTQKKHTCLNIMWNVLWYLLIFPGTVRLTPNIAKNGNATKSSVHRWGGHPASNANDGNLDTNVNTCALTGPSAPSWWQVDLLDVFEIHRVALTVASQACKRQSNNYFPYFRLLSEWRQAWLMFVHLKHVGEKVVIIQIDLIGLLLLGAGVSARCKYWAH